VKANEYRESMFEQQANEYRESMFEQQANEYRISRERTGSHQTHHEGDIWISLEWAHLYNGE
jgi:hypothetical protein